jgi:hypothetical protein
MKVAVNLQVPENVGKLLSTIARTHTHTISTLYCTRTLSNILGVEEIYCLMLAARNDYHVRPNLMPYFLLNTCSLGKPYWVTVLDMPINFQQKLWLAHSERNNLLNRHI